MFTGNKLNTDSTLHEDFFNILNTNNFSAKKIEKLKKNSNNFTLFLKLQKNYIFKKREDLCHFLNKKHKFETLMNY